MTTREIIAAALALPREARAQIVDELTESLDDDAEPDPIPASPEMRELIRERWEVAKHEPVFTMEEILTDLRR